MCTAVTYKTNNYYFGRNLDLERSYGERVVITPRFYEFPMRCVSSLCEHYAMIGMATVVDGYPLYYEATNEKGLSMAGLTFPHNSDYKEYDAPRIILRLLSLFRGFWPSVQTLRKREHCLIKLI